MTIIKLLGGLGLFIYGMKLMGDGLENAAGEGLKKILEKVERKCLMNEVDVIKVDPRNTSKIGKEKYTKIKGLSVHYCAAYVINRRGMGFVD